MAKLATLTRPETDPVEVTPFAQENLDLGIANDLRTATLLEASAAKMALCEMYSHRGDGIPTRYKHSSDVADLARVMWLALLTEHRHRISSTETLRVENAELRKIVCGNWLKWKAGEKAAEEALNEIFDEIVCPPLQALAGGGK